MAGNILTREKLERLAVWAKLYETAGDFAQKLEAHMGLARELDARTMTAIVKRLGLTP